MVAVLVGLLCTLCFVRCQAKGHQQNDMFKTLSDNVTGVRKPFMVGTGAGLPSQTADSPVAHGQPHRSNEIRCLNLLLWPVPSSFQNCLSCGVIVLRILQHILRIMHDFLCKPSLHDVCAPPFSGQLDFQHVLVITERVKSFSRLSFQNAVSATLSTIQTFWPCGCHHQRHYIPCGQAQLSSPQCHRRLEKS